MQLSCPKKFAFIRVHSRLTLLIFLLLSPAFAEPPADALKYHTALLKRPSNDTLFDRFFSAWIDEQDITELEKFLISRAEQNSGPDLAILSRFHLRRGNEEAALESLAKAITALPEDFTLPMERAKILVRRLDFPNARKDLTTVTSGSDPALSLEASKLIGKTFLREGNTEEAIKTWDAILAANPGDEDLLEDLVESAASENEIDQALVYVDKLITASSDPYKKTLRQLRRGDLLSQAGRHDDSIKAYSETLTNVGEGSWLEREVMAQIDKAFRKQDRIDDLKQTLANLAEANPRRLLIHRELARIEAAQGEIDSAIGRFREVLQRSPGNRELREEFIRLLTDAEKFDDASAELQKLIESAPQEPNLLLQLADLNHRQNKKPEILEALNKAHNLLGIEDESAGIRIASLMLQYGLNENGESILTKLTTAPNATEAPSEALAAEYARSNRKPQALEILKKIAASDNLETVLRAAGSISALSEPIAALDALTAKNETFDKEPRFLIAITQASLAAQKPDLAVTHAIKLVRLASPATDIAEAISLALRSIQDAKQTEQWRDTLTKQPNRSTTETCLLAALAEANADFDSVTKIFENATDPTLIRFHTAILDKRGELDLAIKTLSSLSSTDEGRKASYFKDMADLQRRSGLTEEALKTLDLWKQTTPGDKTPWITTTSILREEGRAQEAIKSTRQAVARFGEDNDLAATLADLHEDAGNTDDAESIYWRLYDDAASPADQTRWAASLAQLANSSGRTEELSEKLQVRARNNRRSVGPILAQAELARITRNDEKRRDLLLEAVRLQPKDVDLRLQIANLEEQSGNPERVIAILEEALPSDTTNRVRSALAQAYLRQGQTIKGMRELRILAGNQSDDPRIVEQSASSLATSGLYDEAINFFRDALPDGGDWRSKYLLAVLLEQDGREAEAIPLFQSLLQASGEIKNLNTPTTNRYNPYGELANQSADLKKLSELISSTQAAYVHKNRNNYGGGYFPSGTMAGSFLLPTTPDAARNFALIHLAKLNVDNLPNGDFIKELVRNDITYRPDFSSILKKFPDYPGLLELVLISVSWGNDQGSLDIELIRNSISKNKNLSPNIIFSAKMLFACEPNAPQAAWDELIATAKDISTSTKKEEIVPATFQLFNLVSEKKVKLPETAKKTLSDILLNLATSEHFRDGPYQGYHLYIITSLGSTEHWIKAANEEIAAFRKKYPKGAPATQMNMLQRAFLPGSMRISGMSGYQIPSPFNLPSIEASNYVSVPEQILGMIGIPEERDNYYGNKPIDPKSLITHLNSISSPFLQAYIAMKAANPETIEKTLNITPPDMEVTDFATLRSIHQISQKQFTAAYNTLSSIRPSFASDRNRIASINLQLLAIAAEMSAEDRTKVSTELEALLIQVRRTLGSQYSSQIAAHAEILGLPELAKRFATKSSGSQPNTLGSANFGLRQLQPSQSNNASIDKMKKFSSDGKHEAAALEALNLIRKAYKSRHNSNYEIHQIREAISPEAITELLKLTNPGESTSLTKLTEYADICIDFNKPQEAVTILSKLHTQRPTDSKIATKLAFILPKEQKQKSIELLTVAVKDETFPLQAYQYSTNFYNDRTTENIFKFYDIIASWLEQSSPESLQSSNLTWISYISRSFFEANTVSNISSLRHHDQSRDDYQGKLKKTYEEFVALNKRLAIAMLKFNATAEEGFRLLSATTAWKIPDNELDNHARSTLLAVASLKKSNSQRRHSFFSFEDNFSTYGAGDALDEFSSAMRLASRISSAKSPDEILPPAFLAQISEKDKSAGELVSLLAKMKSAEDLQKAWDSGPLSKSNDPFSQMLCLAIFDRASSIPNSEAFFLKIVQEIQPLWHQHSSDDRNNIIIRSALRSASAKNTKHMTALCSAVSRAIYGENADFKSPTDEFSQSLYYMRNAFNGAHLKPETTFAFIREFYKLGVPISSSDSYGLSELARKLPFNDVKKSEETLNSLSLLDPIETWAPTVVITIESDYNGSKYNHTRSEKFILPDLFNYASLQFSRTDLVSQLENRKPQTFGSLITAASITQDEAERTRLTDLAFSQNSKKIASLPPDRLSALSPLIPWISEKTLKTLPPAISKKFNESKNEELTKLQQAADEFIKSNPDDPNILRYNSPFDTIDELVLKLAPLDMDKAVAVFLEAERRFTTNITKGLQLSSYSSNYLQITERDEALQDLLNHWDESPQSIQLALTFHKAIADSPQASNFSFAASRQYTPILFEIGELIFESRNNNDKTPYWLQAVKIAESLPNELKNDAHFSMGIYHIGAGHFRNHIDINANRKELNATKDLPEIARQIRTLTIGVSKYSNDNPEGRIETQKAFTYLANLPDVAPTTKFQLFFICAYMSPAMLQDSVIAEIFTSAYEQYAAANRSAINSIGLHSAFISFKAPATEECAPFRKRINSAFWNNANSPKSAGHPEIPQALASQLLLAAVSAKDDKIITKVFNLDRPSLIGDCNTIFVLITHGYFDLAKQILPPLNKLYRIPSSLPQYNPVIEKQLNEFRKLPDVNPISILRFEAILIDICPPNKGKTNLTESFVQRQQRIISSYLASPPKDIMLRTEIVGRIARNSHVAAISLRDEILDIRKSLDLSKALKDWGNGTGSPDDLVPRYLMAPPECVIFRQAAWVEFLDGNLSGLKNIAKVISEQPVASGNSNYRSTDATQTFFDSVHEFAPLYIAEAITLNKTQSFTDAVEVFAEFLAIADKRNEFDSGMIAPPLSLTEFFAHWNNQPEKHIKLFDQVKREKQRYNYFRQPDGMFRMSYYGSKNFVWNSPSFAEKRRNFYVTCFSRKEMAKFYTSNPQGLNVATRDHGIRDLILNIAANPPKDILPNVLPQILKFRSDYEFNNKRPDSGVIALQAAINACPPEKPWSDSRIQWSFNLADKYYGMKKFDDTEKVLKTLNPNSLNPNQKKNLQAFYEKIQKNRPK